MRDDLERYLIIVCFNVPIVYVAHTLVFFLLKSSFFYLLSSSIIYSTALLSWLS